MFTKIPRRPLIAAAGAANLLATLSAQAQTAHDEVMARKLFSGRDALSEVRELDFGATFARLGEPHAGAKERGACLGNRQSQAFWPTHGGRIHSATQ